MFNGGFCYCVGQDSLFEFYMSVNSNEVFLSKMKRFRKKEKTNNFILILD